MNPFLKFVFQHFYQLGMGWDTLGKTSDVHLGNNLGQVEHQPRDVTTEVDLKHHDDNDDNHGQLVIIDR